MDEITRCRQGLDKARARREEALGSWRDANENLAGWCTRARAAGMPMTEIARLAGITRAAVYELIERGSSSAPRGPGVRG